MSVNEVIKNGVIDYLKDNGWVLDPNKGGKVYIKNDRCIEFSYNQNIRFIGEKSNIVVSLKDILDKKNMLADYYISSNTISVNYGNIK